MNFKRARFWRNLLLFSALSSAASLHSTKAEDGVSRIGDGAANQTAGSNSSPGVAGVPGAEGYVPLSASPYMPLDPGYNFNRPMPPALPPAYDTLRNSRRDAIGPRFDVGQFLNDRLGVDGGDTNFNFLLPFLVGSDHEVLFVDGRGLVSQAGRGGASAGVGYRVYDADMDRVLGISGWVDYDDTNNRTYQQAGLSFESLGRWIDVRLNGYMPFGRDHSVLSRSFVGNPFFGGSHLLVNQRTASESAFYGMDAEIGGPLPVLGRYGVSGYVGGYWLDSQTDDTAAGPRVRFEANVTDSFRVNVSASNDDVFGTNAWVNFQMTLPDGRARRWFRPIPVEDKLLTTVHRDYRVHAHTRIDVAPTPVLMASGENEGQPVMVVFVDPDRMVNGIGTLESPLNRFVGFTNSPSNTLVIVDGSASSNPVLGNVTLFSDQKLLSTSILAAGGAQLDTNLGLITLPRVTGFGNATPVSPILLSRRGGTLVTLARNSENTEVAGFTFNGTTGDAEIPHAVGIFGENIVDFNIHHNTFENYTNGVVLNNVTGLGLFQANTLTGTPGVSNDGFRVTNSGEGTLNLFVDTYAAPPPAPTGPAGTTPANTLPLLANTITGNDGAGIRVTARNRAEINAHIVGNFVGVNEDRDSDGVLDVHEDLNGNGVLDVGEDRDRDGRLDFREDLNGDGKLTRGTNGDGIVLNADATRGLIRGSVVGNTIDGNRGEDRNGNGILDPGEDRDGDELLTKGSGLVLIANAGTLEMATLGEDRNGNGKLDPSEDRNGNGILDLSEDTNGNGVLDLSEDLNGNGVLDAGEDANNNGVLDLSEDTNFNGTLDLSEDTNGNGLLDAAEDLNGNGVMDVGEDRNRNGRLDVTEDLNRNGRLDAGEDTNGNGQLDLAEDVNGNGEMNGNGPLNSAEDLNGNGILDGGYIISGNVITNNNGDAIKVTGTNNANINLLFTQNTIGDPNDRTSGNGGRGLSITADSGIINAQIGWLTNEDVNFNSTLDTEDLNGNGRLDLNEDANDNGLLDTEDTNGNGMLDVADPRYGNTFMANQGGGILADLTGTAVGNIVALNNVIGNGDGSLTFLIDGATSGVPFTFTNSSQRGINLTGLTWEIAPAFLEFDTALPGTNSQDFTVSNNTVTLTGLTSVNGLTTGTPVAGTNNVTYGVADSVPGAPSTSLALRNSRFLSVNGVLDRGEDANLNGVLDAGEDTNLNGVLDAGEDTNRNGRLDAFEDRPLQFAFAIDVDGTGGVPETTFGNDFIGSTVRATFSSGHVLTGTMQPVPGNAQAAQFVATSPVSNLVAGSGIELRASGGAEFNNPTFIGNDVRFQGGAGFAANATEDGEINNDARFQGGAGFAANATEDGEINNLLVQGNTIQNNGTTANPAGGIRLTTSTSTTASITGSILNNRSTANIGPGVSLTADGGSINVREIDGNLLNGNTNGLALNTLNEGVIATRVTNNTMDNSTQDGFTVTADTGLIVLNQFSDNSVSNSGTDTTAPITRRNGVRWEALNDGTFEILETEDENGNNILDPDEDLNDNGLLDRGVAINRLSEDLNGNGVLEIGEDVNGNNRLDVLEDLNRNGILDPGEDLNANGILDVTEDLNRNGILDPGEDLNGNSTLDRSEDLNLNGRLDVHEDKNNNGVLDLAVFTTQLPEDINGNDILDPGEDANANGRLDVPEDKNLNGVLDPTEDLNSNGILDAGEDVNGNGVLDLSEDLNGNGVLDAFPFSNRLDNNAGSGLLITGTDGIFNLDTVSGLSVDRRLTGIGGIVIDVTDSVVIGQFVGNTLISDATNISRGPGFSLTATGSPGDLGNLFGVSVENNGEIDDDDDDDDDGNLFLVSVDNNRIDGNAGAGIAFVMRQDAFGSFAILNNTITRTQNEFNEDVNGNGALDPSEDTDGDGILDQGEDRNGNGVLDLAEDLNGNGVWDSVTTPFAGEGIFVQMVGMAELPNARGILSDSFIQGNRIGGLFSTDGNVSHGIAFDLQEETAVRDLEIGGGNLIVNNFGDGINFRRRDNAEVEDALIFQNLIDRNGEDLDGDGVLSAGEDLNGNGLLDGDGIRISASEGGRTILGFDLQENEITRNRLSGIHLHVAADARLDVDITRNLIDANGTPNVPDPNNPGLFTNAALTNFASGRGILTTENFGHSTDMREIGGEWIANTITNNAGQGIRLDGTSTNIFNEIEKNLQAQNLMIGGNLIDNNGLDGILVNGPGHVTIDSNTITNNGTNVGLALGTAADPATTGSDLGNGIAVRSVMLDEFGNVANQFTSLPEDMNAPGSTLELRAAGPKFVEIFRNLIQGNVDDGLEIRHANRPSILHDAELHPGHFPLNVFVRDNTIELNGLRGIDILNQGGARTPEFVDDGPPETGADDSVNPPVATVANTSNQFSPTDSTIRLLSNKIASNGKEGIYVVNTASLTQGQAGDTPVPAGPEDPTRGLNEDGEVDSVPRLALEVDHNLVIKNGQRLDVDAQGNPIDTITGSGLVIRVGTSDNQAPPLLIGAGGFTDFASAPGDPSATIFGETGFRNADEILAATGVSFGQLGFFNRLQPGGVVAKITNNGLDALGQRDSGSGFEGNFGADVYIESFRSTGVGAQFPVVARLDMIFERNAGDSLDVTNFGAFFDQNPQRNGQRLAGQINVPGITLPIFGRVVGVHNGSVLDDPATGIDDATVNSFFARDQADPTDSPLDDRANIYNQREVVLSVAPDTDADAAFVGAYGGLGGGNSFSLNQSLLAVPSNNDPFRVELSSPQIFDVILFSGGDPQNDNTAAPSRGNFNLNSNVFAGAGALLVFIDELGVSDAQQPVRTEQATIANNFAVDFGQAQTLANPSPFHVQTGIFRDRPPAGTNTPQGGEGPVAANSELRGLTGLFVQDKTSNQTLVLPAGALSRAPRDGNLFVITGTEFGAGPSAFRVSGAVVAAQAELGIGVNTNAFTHNNLGFDDAVSLESGNPQGDEHPFEWGVLPDANRTRILNIFSPLSPLPAAPPTFKDFTFRRIVFPQ